MKKESLKIRVIISFLLFLSLFNGFSLLVESAGNSAISVAINENYFVSIPDMEIAGLEGLNGLYTSSTVNAFDQVLYYSPAMSSASKSTRLVLLAANNKMMTIDGLEKQINSNPEVVPLIVDGSVYAPLRLITEQFGVIPTYKNGIYTVDIGNQTTTFNILTNEAYINETLVSPAVNSFYHQGYLYLPVDLIGKGLNKAVRQDEDVVAIGEATAVQEYKDRIQIPVLMYHHFDKEVQNGVIADPVVFEKQMTLLKNNGYTTLTTQDVIAITKGEQAMPEKPIMITLDDAYESNYHYVYPVLKKLNMKATIFVITSFIEHPEIDTVPYPKMTWDMMKEMSDSGLVSFQSHTDNLHYSAGGKGAINTPITINGIAETTEQYEERIYNDLVRSKQTLEEKLGKPVTSFAYPKGLYSEASEAILKKAGFELTLTTDKGLYNIKRDKLYLMKRVNVHGKASAESIFTTIQEVKAM